MATTAMTATSPLPLAVWLGSNNDDNGDGGNDGDGDSSSGNDGSKGNGNDDGKGNNYSKGDGDNGGNGDGYNSGNSNGDSNSDDGINGNLFPSSPVVQLGGNGYNDGNRHRRWCAMMTAMTKTVRGQIVSSKNNIF